MSDRDGLRRAESSGIEFAPEQIRDWYRGKNVLAAWAQGSFEWRVNWWDMELWIPRLDRWSMGSNGYLLNGQDVADYGKLRAERQ